MSKVDSIKSIDLIADDLYTLSDAIFDHPETGYTEAVSSKLQIEALRKFGFTVEENLADIPTAFSGRYGSGHPVIGILGEFDALSGLSQIPGSAEKTPIVSGGNGHGCGHNLLGSAGIAAAVGVMNYLKSTGSSGTVIYFGCPAEEGGSGKGFMSRDGVFDELDAAVTWHPSDINSVMYSSSLANILVDYHFDGIASHAAGAPELGRSALDAVTLMNTGVQFLREHVVQEARIHYAVTNTGGISANVVQPEAEVRYMIRAPKIAQVLEIYERINDIAKGAALMTGTTESHKFIKATSDVQPNKIMAKLMYKNMNEIDLPIITDEDRAFAKEIRATVPAPGQSFKNMISLYDEDVEEAFSKYADDDICTYILPITPREGLMAGSSDVGDVSQVCPTGWINTATMAMDTPGHSWQLTAQGKSHLAHESELYAAKVMAASVIDMLEDEQIIIDAKKDFDKRRNGIKFVSPIPKDVKPPVPQK